MRARRPRSPAGSAVSLSFITRLLQRRRQAATLAPKPHGGGHPPALDQRGLKRLRKAVPDQPDAALAEWVQRLGASCSIMALFRALRKLSITRKKKSLPAQERDSPRAQRKRRAFRGTVAGLEPQHLVFVDETGANTAMTRTHGRAPRGKRVPGAVPGPWKSVTLVAGLRLSGVVAPMAFEGAMDAASFQSYIDQILKPHLCSGDGVIWDNLKAHPDGEARAAVEEAQAQVQPLPPYSPDLSPIEKLWSQAQEVLRSVAGRTTETVYGAMKTAFERVTPQDIQGWFRSCGLCATQT